MALILLIGLALLFIDICMKAGGRAAEQRLGIPVRNIVSAGVGVEVPLKPGTGIKNKTLFSKKHRVAGRIDYLTDVQGTLVPVEYKKAMPRQPRESDGYQLLTYCFLLEEEGHAVQRGMLRYANGMEVVVSYGPRQRQGVVDILGRMRESERLPLQAIPGKHDQRCRGHKR